MQLGPLARPRFSQSHGLDRVDRYGDPLPDGAVARLGTVRFRRGTECAFAPDSKTISPDGKRLGVSLDGGTIVDVLDLGTGKPVHQ